MKDRGSKAVYFDYAATTPLDNFALKAMLPYFSEKYGNSATLYQSGRQSRQALEKSRETLASLIGVKSGEIIFTSSATESNNLAIKGVAFANRYKGNHIIVSAIEHESVLEPVRWLEQQGFELTIVPVDKKCQVNPQEVEKALRDDTILVSIMHANNETGALQPIRDISKILSARRTGSTHVPIFHTDAVQTFGKIPVSARTLGVDMLTASSHKVYGPKGAAFLFVKNDLMSAKELEPILHGGGHEGGLRSSTINVPAIVGFGEAASRVCKEQKKEYERMEEINRFLYKTISENIPGASVNVDVAVNRRLPHIMSFRFDKVSGEELLFALDRAGFEVSVASGCSSITLEPSHVLMACGLTREQALNSIRISTGRGTSMREAKSLVKAIKNSVEKIRSLHV